MYHTERTASAKALWWTCHSCVSSVRLREQNQAESRRGPCQSVAESDCYPSSTKLDSIVPTLQIKKLKLSNMPRVPNPF